MPITDADIDALLRHIRDIYGSGPIPLHRPSFQGNERRYLTECIDSNFVSSVGARVTEFECRIAEFVGARHAVATVNGTAALQVALQMAGVCPGDEVITQALTFIATCNAVHYAGAHPVFVDVDLDSMGMSPDALQHAISTRYEQRGGFMVNRRTGRRLAACLPMHTFGHPCRIEQIVELCARHRVPVVEDAAEALGSYIGTRHTGTHGLLATLSFNGNKIITTGGGGMIITNDDALATRAKHLTTTAKIPHPYEFVHDEIGYNYRLPNLNAALGCAQMEQLPEMLASKAAIADGYSQHLHTARIRFVAARTGTRPNYWLNAVRLESSDERDLFLRYTNERGVMTRPIWRLMSSLPMYSACEHDDLANSTLLESQIVNLPSSVPEHAS